ncbi:MAG TPA: exodeoxyribonuclease VII large subunit, partial [Acidobacteriota bacterium]|nr:exodeoxyribonuclease VII large subunit [Acidobacteriota bacterium]
KLLREGLFDEERKRPLPAFPDVVGVVTSATGAAFVDITETIADRFPGMRIVLAPVRVQGAGAAEQIIAALAALNRRDDIDVIIAGRGGGSLEDLWAFNEEIVARAIAASRIPVISAVGHEVDFTIADGVADVRAATPTAAAQIVTDGWVGAVADLPVLTRRLMRAQADMMRGRRTHLDRLRMSHALRRPADMLDRWSQRLDETSDRLQLAARTLLRARQEKIGAIQGHLTALSPEGVLGRGYSITRRRGEKAPLRNADAVGAGDELETRLAEGTVISRVSGPGD